ncbi:MAG: hypothetical protein U1E73_14145 [Planctomycetota bacterium]
MASLELLVDASGVIRGASDVRGGLDQLIDSAYEAESATGRLSETITVTGASAREAWGASRGGLEIARGLSQTATATVAAAAGARDFSSAVLGAAGALSNLSRAREEWRNLSTAMATTRTVAQEVIRDQFGIATGIRNVVNVQQAAVTGWGALWAVIKANPLTAVVTGLSAVGAAMSIFSSKTKEATDEWKGLGDAMKGAQAGIQASGLLGLSSADFLTDQQKTQFSALQRVFQANTPASAAQIGDITGSRVDVVRLLAERGDKNAQSYLQTGRFIGGYTESNFQGTHPWFTSDLSLLQVPVDAQKDILRRTYDYYGKLASDNRAASASAYVFGTGLYGGQFGANPDPLGLNVRGFNGVQISPGQQGMVDFENSNRTQAEIDKEHNDALNESLRIAREIGDTLGSAGFDFAAGLRSGREILKSLLTDFGRGLSRSGLSSLAEHIVTSFNGGKQTSKAKTFGW